MPICAYQLDAAELLKDSLMLPRCIETFLLIDEEINDTIHQY